MDYFHGTKGQVCNAEIQIERYLSSKNWIITNVTLNLCDEIVIRNKLLINYHLFDCFDPVLHIEVGIIRSYVEHYDHSLKIRETSMYHDKISMLHVLFLSHYYSSLFLVIISSLACFYLGKLTIIISKTFALSLLRTQIHTP